MLNTFWNRSAASAKRKATRAHYRVTRASVVKVRPQVERVNEPFNNVPLCSLERGIQQGVIVDVDIWFPPIFSKVSMCTKCIELRNLLLSKQP